MVFHGQTEFYPGWSCVSCFRNWSHVKSVCRSMWEGRVNLWFRKERATIGEFLLIGQAWERSLSFALQIVENDVRLVFLWNENFSCIIALWWLWTRPALYTNTYNDAWLGYFELRKIRARV
jgi:hypothetical protein